MKEITKLKKELNQIINILTLIKIGSLRVNKKLEDGFKKRQRELEKLISK
jgi:hypothetical protein